MAIPILIGIPVGFICEGLLAGFYYGQDKLSQWVGQIDDASKEKL